MRRLLEVVNRWRRVVAFRGAYLAILGVMQVLYGTAILVADYHEDHGHAPLWWPASVDHVAGLHTEVWGWAWLAFGVFTLSGVARRRDVWQFTVAEGFLAGWGLVTVVGAPDYVHHGRWGITGIYFGLAALTLLASAWPDPPPPPNGDGR